MVLQNSDWEKNRCWFDKIIKVRSQTAEIKSQNLSWKLNFYIEIVD